MYQVLLFDADNTLFDFDACERQAMQETFARHDIVLTEEMSMARSRGKPSYMHVLKRCLRAFPFRRMRSGSNMRIRLPWRGDIS